MFCGICRSTVRYLALIFATTLLFTTGTAAQQTVEVRTKDGRSFHAESLQVNGGQMLIRQGGGALISVPIGDVACVGVACGSTSPQQAAPLAAQAGAHFGIHGSNTIGAKLMPELVKEFAAQLHDTQAKITFSQQQEELSIALRKADSDVAMIDLKSHGSGTAFEGLLSGAATIGMSSRRIKPEEVKALGAKYGVDMVAAGSEHVVALDGLAIVVNRENPLTTVAFSKETLARIFAGEIMDWSELGGKPGRIKVHARDHKSGTYSSFEDLVMKPYKRQLRSDAQRYESSDKLSDEVEADVDAIGFIGLPYVKNNQALAIGHSCGIGHAPSRFAIQSEVYPLSRRLYLYTLGAPRDPIAQQLVAYAVSNPAQQVVRRAEFIDQTIELEDAVLKEKWLKDVVATRDPRAPPQAWETMLQTVRSKQRASVVFRFATNSAELDNKARQDVQRLAQLLKSKTFADRRAYLVGFADALGLFVNNERLSFERAAAVARALATQGVIIPRERLLAFSWLTPVACNDDEESRALNRRVELWFDAPAQ